MSAFWDDRFRGEAYAYGTDPNRFFASQLARIPQGGRVLFVAEGEGRNAVYAAEQGYEVHAFDTSGEGRRKALALADARGVPLAYETADSRTVTFPAGHFAGVVLVFAHLPGPFRKAVHRRLLSFLAPGGHVILEGFSVAHQAHQKVNPLAGGPLDADRLYTLEDIREDFDGLEPVVLEEVESSLEEGAYHQGQASLIRFVGRKPV
jgi:SAM-dependent methyltransferase